MELIPAALAMKGQETLVIDWSDGHRREYSVRELRDACPCATCREKRGHAARPPDLLPILSSGETKPLRIASMDPVGNYAYQITFSDGHDTGIFSLDLLSRLGTAVPRE
jgi:DUF971 family protein